MKFNKVSGLIKMSGSNVARFASHLNVSRQQLTNKKKTDAFTADDLIQLADFTNTSLCFVDKKGKVVLEFDMDDLQEKTKEKLKSSKEQSSISQD